MTKIHSLRWLLLVAGMSKGQADVQDMPLMEPNT